MNIFEVKKPLVGDPSRAYLLKKVLRLSDSNTRLLDVGCGTCSLWEPLMEKIEFELQGVDIDEEKIEIAKRVVVNVKNGLMVGKVQDLSRMFPASFFNIVVSTQLFYLLWDLRRALREINFVLKPYGKLLFTTELPRLSQSLSSRLLHEYAKVKGFIKRKEPPKRRDEKELSPLLEEAGFVVESAKFFHIPPLKLIHNRIISDKNKNKVMRKWLELEEELMRDDKFYSEAKIYCRNLYIEAVKTECK